MIRLRSYLALFIPQLGQQRTVARLQMCGANGELLVGFANTEIHGDRHLIALNAPHLQHPALMVDHFKFIRFVENRTTIGTVVLVYVQTG